MIPRPLFALLITLAAFGPLAIDLYLPSLGHIAQGLNTSMDQVQLTVTLFLVGFGIGMLFYGPMSDRFGRKTMILWGTALFTLASAGCAMTQQIEHLQLFRLIQAFGGGAASAISRATVKDLCGPGESARLMSLLALFTSIAPLTAPIAGAWILEFGSWRLEFVTLTAIGAFTLLAVWAILPETLSASNSQRSIWAALKGYPLMLSNRRSLLLLGSGGSLFGAMFAYITGTPHVYIQVLGLSEKTFALLFGLNILSLMIFGAYSARHVGRLGSITLIQKGSHLALLGGFIALSASVLASNPTTHLLSATLFVTGFVVSVGALGLISPNTQALLLDQYPKNAGGASALFGFTQFALGAAASGAVAGLFDGSAMPMGLTSLAFIVASWVFSQFLAKSSRTEAATRSA